MGLCEAIFAENPDLPVFGARVLGLFLCVRLPLILAAAQPAPGAARRVLRRLPSHRLPRHQHLHVSSPGFCGDWFIWCRWLPVVIVRGGGGRVPRRLRARRGYACRRRSVAGWCPYQWTHSAVATTGGVDVLPRALVTDQLGLVQGVQSLGQSKAERSPPWNPPRRPPRTRTGPARSGWTCTAPLGRSGAPGPSGRPPDVSAARRPCSGRPGPGRCTGSWRSASR